MQSREGAGGEGNLTALMVLCITIEINRQMKRKASWKSECPYQ